MTMQMSCNHPSSVPKQAAKRKRGTTKTTKAVESAKTVNVGAPKAPKKSKGKRAPKGWIYPDDTGEEEALPPAKRTRRTRTAAKASDEQSLQSRLSQDRGNTVAEASAPATTAAKKAHTRKTGTVKQVTTQQGDDAGTAREIPVKSSRVPKPKQPMGKKTAVMVQPTTEGR